MSQNIAIQSNASKIELHYFFSDESHTMDAVIRNKYEHEFLEIVKHVSTLFNVEFELESEAYAEGGLREWWSLTIKKNPTLAAIIIGVLINVLSNYITTDRELNDLQKQELRLSIEKLKQDLEDNKEEPPYIHIENATFIINNDINFDTSFFSLHICQSIRRNGRSESAGQWYHAKIEGEEVTSPISSDS